MARWPSKIKVTARWDRMGLGLNVRPDCEKWAQAFERHRAQYGGSEGEGVYFQEHHADAFLEHVPARARRELRVGFWTTWLADPYDVGCWYGYDAHNVPE